MFFTLWEQVFIYVTYFPIDESCKKENKIPSNITEQ